MDNADGANLLFGGEFAIVKPDLGGLEGVDIDSEDIVFLRLVTEDKIGSFSLLYDEL